MPAPGPAGIVAADAITDNGMSLSYKEPHMKERLRRLLPDYVCGINPLAAFSQDVEMAAKTIEIGVYCENVGSFIMALQAKILDNYVDALKSIDHRSKPIIKLENRINIYEPHNAALIYLHF